MCAALVTLGAAAVGLLPTEPVARQQTEPVTLHDAAAIEQLKE